MGCDFEHFNAPSLLDGSTYSTCRIHCHATHIQHAGFIATRALPAGTTLLTSPALAAVASGSFSLLFKKVLGAVLGKREELAALLQLQPFRLRGKLRAKFCTVRSIPSSGSNHPCHCTTTPTPSARASARGSREQAGGLGLFPRYRFRRASEELSPAPRRAARFVCSGEGELLHGRLSRARVECRHA